MPQWMRPDRVDYAKERIARRVREADAVKDVAKKFGCSERHARRLVRLAWEEIRAERGDTRDFDLERMEALFEEAATIARLLARKGKERALVPMVQALRQLGKLRGVYPEDRPPVPTGGGAGNLGIKDNAELQRRIEELNERRAVRQAVAATPRPEAEPAELEIEPKGDPDPEAN